MNIPENIIYKDNFIHITNARAIIGATTYAIANITSVGISKIPVDNSAPILIGFIGLGIGLFGCLMLVAGLFIQNNQNNSLLSIVDKEI